MLISQVLLLVCICVLSQKPSWKFGFPLQGKERKLSFAEGVFVELSALTQSLVRQRYLGPDNVLVTLNVWHGVEVTLLHGAVCV